MKASNLLSVPTSSTLTQSTLPYAPSTLPPMPGTSNLDPTDSQSPAEEKRRLNLAQSTVDMLSGVCAGIVATFVAHPLDTVKVRFQVS